MSRRTAALFAAACTLSIVAAPASAEGWIAGRLGLGLHAEGGSLSDSDNQAAEPLDVGGGGLQARYRVSPRWELELSVGGLDAETPELRRSIGLGTVGVLFHLNPASHWVWSVLGGVGGGDETVEMLSPGGSVVEEHTFTNRTAYLGGGIERRFGRFSLAAELRLSGIRRDDEAADGPAFAGTNSPTPREMGGGQLRLLGTFYL